MNSRFVRWANRAAIIPKELSGRELMSGIRIWIHFVRGVHSLGTWV
jgi:hypothetical protein